MPFISPKGKPCRLFLSQELNTKTIRSNDSSNRACFINRLKIIKKPQSLNKLHEPKVMKKIYVLLLTVMPVIVFAQPRVVLDSYFNDEHMKDASGKLISYHYKWEEKDNNGFSIFGDAFKNNGAQISTLYQEPTSSNLKQADIYIIVDPDTRKESPDPKYIFPNDVKVISNWVKH